MAVPNTKTDTHKNKYKIPKQYAWAYMQSSLNWENLRSRRSFYQPRTPTPTPTPNSKYQHINIIMLHRT